MVKDIANFKNILNKTPLRVSFSGGGTELPKYYSKFGGAVINTTINLFIYTKIEKEKKNIKIILEDINIKKKISLKFNKNLYFKNKNFMIHLAVYKNFAKKFLKNKIYPIKITTYSDAEVGSGLGSSSTLTVSLIKAMSGYFNIKLSKKKIAEFAFQIERVDLGLQGGLQDHYAASYGGLNYLKIIKKKVTVKKIKSNAKIIEKLNRSMLLVYTGIKRESSLQIKKNLEELENEKSHFLKYLHYQKKITMSLSKLFLKNNFSKIIIEINKCWDYKNFILKKDNQRLFKLVQKIKTHVAFSIKVSGAGGGGFLFCLIDPFKTRVLKKIISRYKYMFITKISIYNKGSENYFF
jgi:D-glycero-alpha-D-manno-heptose-7-phosphate kinase